MGEFLSTSQATSRGRRVVVGDPMPLARGGAPTEAAGARAAQKSAASIRERIVELLKDRALTDDELEVAWEQRYGVPTRRFFGNTLRRRRHELKQMGVVTDSLEKRLSRSGLPNIVWAWTGKELEVV